MSTFILTLDKLLEYGRIVVMKIFLYRFINGGPPQVGSTFLWFIIISTSWRGIVSMWNNPPKAQTWLVVLCIGIAFAILGAILNIPKFDAPNEKNVDETEK